MSLDQIEYIKLSPGIGMARVGNSDTDFIGPETPGIPPNPTGGFKDAEHKIKPMSSRFRVFGYNAAGEVIKELNMGTSGVTSLDWTVHMANKKAANYAFQGKFGFTTSDLRNPGVQPGCLPDERDQLIIDPGPVSITGANIARKPMTGTIFKGITEKIAIPTSNIMGCLGQSGNTCVTYNEKEVTIGWLKTDPQGRLVIVGGKGLGASLTTPETVIQKGPGHYNPVNGKKPVKNIDPNSNGNQYFNNPGWYDDTGGGSVNASVTFNTSKGPRTLTSTGSQTLSNNEVIDEKNKRAWIAVAPPKYAPSMENVVSLADLQHNIFPEAAPGAGSLFIAADSATNGFIDLYNSKTGVDFQENPQVETTEKAQFSPAIATYKKGLYCAFISSEPATANSIILATSTEPESTSTYTYHPQKQKVYSDVGLSLTVYNDTLYCAALANDKSSSDLQGKVVLGGTTGTQFAFNPISFKLATSSGTQDFTGTPTQPVELSAYNGQLYMALTVDGNCYLGTPSTSVAYQFNLQKVGQTSIVSNLAPSLSAFDDRLYYAITDSVQKVQYGSLNLNGPQVPLNPNTPNDTTPKFNIDFAPVLVAGSTSSASVTPAATTPFAPSISGFNGKLYCLVVGKDGKGQLYTKTPLIHVRHDKVTKEEEPIFSASVAEIRGVGSRPSITAFETVEFYRDILPVLKTVTDYAFVNKLAFDGHGPTSQGNFVRPPYLDSLANPNSANSLTRTSIFHFIRPGEWLTEVPPPPKDFTHANVPQQVNQQGTLMPHLAGTGGSVDENIFNDTKFPGQWLSLTRHQLEKFQKWVNGQFNTGESIPAPIPIDNKNISDTEKPALLDLAALELTVGGGFHPGIELTYYMAYPEYFCEPFRLTDEITYEGKKVASVTPGSIAGYMSIPWHGDFWSCNTDFWPPQRPDIVVQKIDGVPTPVNWFRSAALQIPETASSDPKWLYGDNPDHFAGNHTPYQTFLKYWSYFGFVINDNDPESGEEVRVETERAKCLKSSSTTSCEPLE